MEALTLTVETKYASGVPNTGPIVAEVSIRGSTGLSEQIEDQCNAIARAIFELPSGPGLEVRLSFRPQDTIFTLTYRRTYGHWIPVQ